MIIKSEAPIDQDIEVEGVKYYWMRSSMDIEGPRIFTNVFLKVQSSDTTANEVEKE